ncbi:MAG TPA: penicillin-binding protein 1A [Micropepsaceae bacterium]|nr:penicillin-binding protein 1A [Micropepsaceae bacterium]
MQRFLKILKWTGISFAGLFIVGAIGITIFLWILSEDLPDTDKLANYEPPVTTRVHAGNGTLIAEFAEERRLFVPIASIPERVRGAFLSAEDKNFYIHPGIDPMGIARALIDNAWNAIQGTGKRPEGASTITQQVAKNFFLSNEVSYARKIQEMLLAFKLEGTYSKDKILELYLNEIFLGQNAYGVAAAALVYFNKSLDELTVAEAAYLAALPKAPSNYHPIRQRDAALERRNWVIGQMEENGYITEEEAEAAKAEDLIVTFRPLGAQFQDAQYFAEEVRRTIIQRYGEESLARGGLQVRSTLNPQMQAMALKAFRDGIQAYDRRHGWRGPVTRIELGEGWQQRLEALPRLYDLEAWRLAVVTEVPNGKGAVKIAFVDNTGGEIPWEYLSWARPFVNDRSLGPAPSKSADVLAPGDVVYVEAEDAHDGGEGRRDTYELRQVPAVNGGMIVLDPHSGRVLALVGGFSFFDSVFNRATQALRQTGSAFKPFVYAAALDNGYTPSSLVLDGPFVYDQGPGLPLWRPQNYSGDFMGLITLRVGLEKSRNLITVRLAHAVGMDKVADFATRAGIVDHMDPMLSFALGAAETTLMRLTGAYSIFVNGGRRVTPTLIDRIQDRYGRTIYRHDDRPCNGCAQDGWHGQEEPFLQRLGVETFDERTSFQVVSILEGVVSRGTATTVRSVGIPVAGKTGTTNDEKDAWFVGFTPDLVVGIYVGFDQPRPMGRGETGGHVAAPIFRDFLTEWNAGRPGIPFRIPPGVVMMRVNARSGQLTSADDPGAILEPFKPGTNPNTTAALTGGSEGATGEDDDAPAGDGDVGGGTGGLY